MGRKTQRVRRKKGPPLDFIVEAVDWYDSKRIQTANFTHDWGSIGCNEMAFLNIALDWPCDHQHNSCYYSFGPTTQFSLYLVHLVIIAELGVNLRLWFLAITDVTVSPPGPIHGVLIDHRNHSADLWKVWRVTGDFQEGPSRERGQLQSCGWGISAFVTTGSLISAFLQRSHRKCTKCGKIHLNTTLKKMGSSCGCPCVGFLSFDQN